jgi:hypothetical protein
MEQRPVIPPNELIEQWLAAPEYSTGGTCMLHTLTDSKLRFMLEMAAQWGYCQHKNSPEVTKGQLTKEQVDSVLESLRDPEDARQFLREAGLIDENGELAKPYRQPEKERKPLLHPDGSLHQFMLKVGGSHFRCECGCNVFHKPDDTDLELYECNSCGNWYRASDGEGDS